MADSRIPPGKVGSEMRPTAASERIDLVDVLRGFAVFGILVANMASYSGMQGGYASWTQPLDRAVFLLTRLLVEAKFYSLFSFLFGWGMAVQMRRADARQSAFLPLYLRRLLALLLFGIIHATLIWTGDILTLYASLGFLLLLFRKRSVRFLLWASLASLVVAVLFTLPWGPVEAFRQAYFDLTSPLVLNHYASGLYAEGSFLEITRLRVQDALAGQVYVFFALGNVFAMFLLGLAAGKLRLFGNIRSLLTRLRRALPALLGAGLLLNGLFVSVIVWPERYPAAYQYPVRVAARTFGAPLLMLAYIGVITLLYQWPAWKRRLGALAPVGRMALSNYILQSLVSTALFYSYGLGLYGRATPAGALLLTLLIYGAQVKLSAWWLERAAGVVLASADLRGAAGAAPALPVRAAARAHAVQRSAPAQATDPGPDGRLAPALGCRAGGLGALAGVRARRSTGVFQRHPAGPGRTGDGGRATGWAGGGQ